MNEDVNFGFGCSLVSVFVVCASVGCFKFARCDQNGFKNFEFLKKWTRRQRTILHSKTVMGEA